MCQSFCSEVKRGSIEAFQDPRKRWQFSCGAQPPVQLSDRLGGALLRQQPEQHRRSGKPLQEGRTRCRLRFYLFTSSSFFWSCENKKCAQRIHSDTVVAMALYVSVLPCVCRFMMLLCCLNAKLQLQRKRKYNKDAEVGREQRATKLCLKETCNMQMPVKTCISFEHW